MSVVSALLIWLVWLCVRAIFRSEALGVLALLLWLSMLWDR